MIKMRFSKKYKTYEEWLENFRGSEAYLNRIIRLHSLHPNATLSQLRGHPSPREKPLKQSWVKFAEHLRNQGFSKEDIFRALKLSFPKSAPSRSEVRKYIRGKPRSFFTSKLFSKRKRETLRLMGQGGLNKLYVNYVKDAVAKLKVKRVVGASEEIKRFTQVYNMPDYRAQFEVEGS